MAADEIQRAERLPSCGWRVSEVIFIKDPVLSEGRSFLWWLDLASFYVLPHEIECEKPCPYHSSLMREKYKQDLFIGPVSCS